VRSHIARITSIAQSLDGAVFIVDVVAKDDDLRPPLHGRLVGHRAGGALAVIQDGNHFYRGRRHGIFNQSGLLDSECSGQQITCTRNLRLQPKRLQHLVDRRSRRREHRPIEPVFDHLN
jgi:hypothetical protein